MIAQAQMRVHSKYDSTPMRSFTHQWNLSRIFGSQPVGCASSPSWPEAGIATRIILAQSSRRVFRRPSNADLATWRLGDLVVDDQRDSSPRTFLRPQLRRFLNLQQGGRGSRFKSRLVNTPSLPKPESPLGIIFHSSNPSCRWMQRGSVIQ